MSSTYQALQCLLDPGQTVVVLFVHAFRWQKLMQNHKPPSFFLTNTTVLHHALWLGWIAPDSSISWRWLWASLTRGRGICLNHSLKGVSSVTLIVCSVEWVQPNSVGSNKNMLWYSAKSQWAVSASSWGQESNPLKSSSSNNFPCLCLTVSVGGVRILGFIPLLQVGLHWWSWHRGCCNCPGHPGFLSEGLWVSHTVPYTMTAFLLPCLSSVYVFLHSKALQQRAISSP